MKKTVCMMLVLVILLSLSLVACNSSATTPSPAVSSSAAAVSTSSSSTAASPAATLDTKNPIKIGYLAWATGADAYMGQVAIMVLQDYIDNINANGGWLGRKVEMIWYDITKDYSEAVNATNKLINQDRVDAIIGPDTSPHAIPLGTIVEKAKIPLFPVCGSTKVTLNDDGTVKPYVFRCAPVNVMPATAFAYYAYNKLGARKIATMVEYANIFTVECAQYFSDTFTKLGGQITGAEGFNELDNEFRAQITKIAQENPDYIYLPAAAYKQVANLAKQMKTLGHSNIKLLGVDAWYNEEVLGVAGPELEGAYLITGVDMSAPQFAPVVKDYETKHSNSNMKLHIYAMYALNALQFLEHAVKTTNSIDGPTIIKALEAIEDLDVSTGGKWHFDKNHNPVGPTFNIFKVENSKFVFKETFAMPTE